MDQTRSNKPNAAKLIASLRNTGYDSYAAIADIIDNSIDAGARSIKVFIEQKDKKIRVTIADNGSGMSESVLDEALKLGSKTERDEVSDLGKFGMGLVTASISMATKLEVITKQEESPALYSSQDLDVVIEKNEFVKVLREASTEEKAIFRNLVEEEHGTVVILSNVDRLSDSNYTQFSATLSKDISRIFRKFIESGIKIFINDKEIIASDPLFSKHDGTKIYSDEVYDLPLSATNGKKEQIRVKIAILPEVNKELEKDLKMNMRTQGFYIMRNNREVAYGATFNLFVRHNSLNRLRGELYFNATIDNEMGVRFTKDGVSPNQAIIDFLKKEIGGQITSIYRVLKREKIASKEMIVDHTDAEQVIAQRAKLLVTPSAVIEKRGKRTDTETDEPNNEDIKEDKNKVRKNFKQTKTSPKGMGARFESYARGHESVLYECYQEGKIIVVSWNTDHPFYERAVLANKESKDLVSALDYLVFALASAELKTTSDENVEVISDIKTIMSSNLRALLS